jgi:uncharacterized membrane protein YwaF
MHITALHHTSLHYTTLHYTVDALKKARAEQKKKLFRYVLFAAKLIAPHIESTFNEGAGSEVGAAQ